MYVSISDDGLYITVCFWGWILGIITIKNNWRELIMKRNGYKQCDCGNNQHFDTEGWGEDENGQYAIYICEECGEELKVYDND
jgi:hypothetical protein